VGQGDPRHGRETGLTPVDVPACASLQEVRERIDALDERIVRLLAERFAYAGQAAGFKKGAVEVPAPERVAQVIARVRKIASENGAPPGVVEEVYRALIAAMIEIELGLKEKPSKV
jgi:isochorismate pyruvate lyase